MNTFEKVPSDGHQMSLAGDVDVSPVSCLEGGGWSWTPSVERMTERQTRLKHYLPATSLAGGNEVYCLEV